MTVCAEGRVENFGFQLDSLEKHLISLTVFTFNRRIFSSFKFQDLELAARSVLYSGVLPTPTPSPLGSRGCPIKMCDEAFPEGVNWFKKKNQP